jgi:hypothetical protein
MRPDGGQSCGDPPRRLADTPDRKTTATGRRPRSRRRSSGRTTGPGHRPAGRSRWRRSSQPPQSRCARPRRAWPLPLPWHLLAPDPMHGGSGPWGECYPRSARSCNGHTKRCTPSSRMLPSVIGGTEKRLGWIGFTFCCASKMADPQSSTCMSLCGFPCTQVEFD